MERIPAAYAEEWSVQLERGLRSKKHGKSIEAILEMGPRLEWWDREPNLTMSAHHTFGLFPGEDRFFANSIFLRLADAFCFGDKIVKFSIVKIFLSLFKGHSMREAIRKKDNVGILSKYNLSSYIELLKRVKTVFYAGDIEEKVMALIMFGCWANLAKDSGEIRYIILSSLISEHVMEAKASLFAAGCFCEISDYFASVLLEMLVNLLTSPETSNAIKLAGGKTFAKLECSSSLATRAYKIGLNLLLESSEDAFFAVMVISISKIASKSCILISRQVELLLSLLMQKKTLFLKAVSLRCLHFIIARGIYFPTSTMLVDLLGMLNESNFPPALRCKHLEIDEETRFSSVVHVGDSGDVNAEDILLDSHNFDTFSGVSGSSGGKTKYGAQASSSSSSVDEKYSFPSSSGKNLYHSLSSNALQFSSEYGPESISTLDCENRAQDSKFYGQQAGTREDGEKLKSLEAVLTEKSEAKGSDTLTMQIRTHY